MRMCSVPSRTELLQHFADTGANVGAGVIGGQAQPGGVVKGLADGQVAVDESSWGT